MWHDVNRNRPLPTSLRQKPFFTGSNRHIEFRLHAGSQAKHVRLCPAMLRSRDDVQDPRSAAVVHRIARRHLRLLQQRYCQNVGWGGGADTLPDACAIESETMAYLLR